MTKHGTDAPAALAVFATVIALSLPACLDAEAPATARNAIVGGAVDDGDPGVVAIGTAPFECDRDVAPSCTGSLVAPQVVLTAAHCVENALPSSLMVFVGTRVADTSETTGVFIDDLRIHPDFDTETLANDLALLHLAGAPPGVAPLAINRDPLDDSVLGAPARLVGFGVTEAGAGDHGVKREGTGMVDQYDETLLTIVSNPEITCAGDSGGPVLLTLGGTELVAGVVSFGDAGCVAQSTSVRVDTAAGFIDDYIAETAMPPADPAPAIADGQACEQECTSDDDCPEALWLCGAQPDGRRCVRPGQVVGDLGGACATDAECPDGTCAVAARDGLRECRCLTPCSASTECDPDDPVPPGEPPCDEGCSCATAGAPGVGSLLLVVLVALALATRRTARLIALLALLAGSACGDRAPAKPTPPCLDVSAHVAELALAEAEANGTKGLTADLTTVRAAIGDLRTGGKFMFGKSIEAVCRRAKLGDAARRCVARARDLGAIARCDGGEHLVAAARSRIEQRIYGQPFEILPSPGGTDCEAFARHVLTIVQTQPATRDSVRLSFGLECSAGDFSEETLACIMAADTLDAADACLPEREPHPAFSHPTGAGEGPLADPDAPHDHAPSPGASP